MSCLSGLFLLFSTQANAENLLVSVGTDIPYQFHAGASYDLNRIRFSARSGILVEPYSSMTISLIGAFGVDEIYINLLESAYQLGSMNSISTQYLLGEKKLWYLGPEFRFDYLTAADTPVDLVESVTGESISTGSGPRAGSKEVDLQMGLMMYAAGLRVGRAIPFGEGQKHNLLVDLSFHKHYSTKTSLYINEEQPEKLNEMLDELLWEDVFLPYGYLGGLGLSYSYSF